MRRQHGNLNFPLFPLQCITDLHRSQGINSSRDLPDNVLTFARRHPLMANQVHPMGVHPLMFKRSVNYVKIVVHKEPALDGNIYTMLFLGTGELGIVENDMLIWRLGVERLLQ